MNVAIHGNNSREEVISCLKQNSSIGVVDDIKNADVLISLGGDGTLLNTLSIVGSLEIPVLGVNLGRLGFLTCVSRDDIPQLADMLIKGAFTPVKRRVLKVSLSNEVFYALNEAAILRNENTSVISVEVLVDERPLNVYSGDGVIFATPTGSTAYSLSCGGPILLPSSDNFVVTPIASHTLTVRPLVLTGDAVIKATCSSDFKFTLDSRSFNLRADTPIVMQRADFSFVTMKLNEKSFFDTLGEKLSWGK
ncbi:MAG: NAD(+)/NADH kinase [Bacteroidales bacterium]|jgi:NAD+ kinase|nr:NAD(+)/NADH kinase [Bacteroidales bacterium]